ncbi:MAG: GTP-binding protein [Rhodobacteraceae bacterium]|nr:GTP-binding protein [Paracoccaceae bacterium]MCZ8085532.1 GTP-binding protein [Paracoccaceae bacterium]
MSRIPLILITGYLGAGKTTLLNALLRDASAGRIAVVVNEFGDVGLDHDLIVETTEETVLLSSGCMCCTVRGDLVQALEGMFEKRSAGKLDFDRIVIETTGLADPAPILHTLIVTPGLGAALRMDGVVTVCDAVNGPATLDAGFESVQQVAMADVLVLSKTDLVTPSQAERFRARLAALAPGARIVTATRGAVPLAELFGHGAPDMNGALPEAEAWVNAPAYALSSLPLPPLAKPLAPLASGPTHGLFGLAPAPMQSLMAAIVPAARHDDRISSVSMAFDEPIHPMMLDIWMETLIAARGPDILRLKAVIWADGFDTPFVIHGVQHIIDPPIRLARWTGKDRKSRVVIIGRDLPREALLDSLEVLKTRPIAHPLPA